MTEVTQSTEPSLLTYPDPVPADQPNDWYVSSDTITVPTWPQEQTDEPNVNFGYDYSQPSLNTTSVTSLDDNLYMLPTPYVQSSPTNESFYDLPVPIYSPPNPTNPFASSLPLQPAPPTPEPVSLPTPVSNGTAAKDKKSDKKSKPGFFTLKRQKPKDDDKKRRASTDVLNDVREHSTCASSLLNPFSYLFSTRQQQHHQPNPMTIPISVIQVTTHRVR